MNGPANRDPALPGRAPPDSPAGCEPMLSGAAPSAEGLAAELRAATELLYSVFDRYPLRPHVEGCECCIGEPENALLRARPLRELPNENLSRFAFKAMTTWGTVADFKHFLPRLFELVAFDDIPVDVETVFGKLEYGGWRTWPAAEQAAVERYLDTLWRASLSDFPSRISSVDCAESCLCAIAQALDDLRPMLHYWLAIPSVPHLRHLARFVEGEAFHGLRPDRLSGPWWDRRPTQMSQAAAWLTHPPIREALERGFFRHADEPFAEELASAVDHIDWSALR